MPLSLAVAIPVVLCAALAVPASAVAQEDDPDAEIARRRFDRGAAAYSRQDYAAALEEFEAARAVKQLPAFDSNIGRCLDRMERIDEAIRAYRRYLAAAPAAEDAPKIRDRIAVLEARRPKPPATRPAPRALPPPPTPRPLPAPASGPSPTGPAILAALSVVLVGVATGLVLSVQPEYDELNRRCVYPCADGRLAGLETRANGGYGGWAAGGAVLAVDLGWWIHYGVKRAGPPRRPLAPSVESDEERP